jgi:hypothetical protein
MSGTLVTEISVSNVKNIIHYLPLCQNNVNGVYIGCSFKLILKVGVEESIVNAPLVSLRSKNTNKAKSKVRFKLIRDL